MRLFVSVDVPDRLRGSLGALQKEFRGAEDLRPTDPGQAHVTLSFLGDVDEERLDDVEAAIGRALEAADVEAFPVELGGVGVFPSLDYVSVVWVGVRDGSAALAALNAALEGELEALGFEGDDHEFTPHVTVGRMDGPGGKETVRELVTEREPDIGRFRASEVRSKASEHTDEGPEYRTVASFPLVGDG